MTAPPSLARATTLPRASSDRQTRPLARVGFGAVHDLGLGDKRRLKALREAGLLTDTAEEAYDRFTRLAATIVDVPITLFTVVTDEKQYFRSQFGLEEPLATTRETPISHSFCQYVVLSSAPL